MRLLIKQLTKLISLSDRTQLTSIVITDSLYGLQSMSSDISEVQELVKELAKKISSTAAVLNSEQIGRALFGLQGFSSSASVFEESAVGIDNDEISFLLSVLWDKIKNVRTNMSLSSIAMGLQGLTLLKDPIANNIKEYLYLQLLNIFNKQIDSTKNKNNSNNNNEIKSNQIIEVKSLQNNEINVNPIDIAITVRGLLLNDLSIPSNLLVKYNEIELLHETEPIILASRADRIITQKYLNLYKNNNNNGNISCNALINGFRLDMLFKDCSLVIELDGPSHTFPARSRFDRVRDEYLTKKLHYTVSLSNHSYYYTYYLLLLSVLFCSE